MEEYIYLLKRTPLFYGIREEELYTLLRCCAAREERYEDGEAVCRMGEALGVLLILLEGEAEVCREDFWGRRETVCRLEPGDSFGEAYSCARTAALPVSVIARGECRAAALDYQRMTSFCSLACGFHGRMVQNLLRMVAEDRVRLENRLEHMEKRSIRDKLLSYLSRQAVNRGARSFDIPFSRRELAEYLGVDRSALSSALGRLREEGLIEFHRNRFTLLEPGEAGKKGPETGKAN